MDVPEMLRHDAGEFGARGSAGAQTRPLAMSGRQA